VVDWKMLVVDCWWLIGRGWGLGRKMLEVDGWGLIRRGWGLIGGGRWLIVGA